VSDVDNIVGLVQTESIQVHAEAYDVALDMSFPKGWYKYPTIIELILYLVVQY